MFEEPTDAEVQTPRDQEMESHSQRDDQESEPSTQTHPQAAGRKEDLALQPENDTPPGPLEA
jgi:hypothetical protein